jgi:hypothetical protein
MRVVAVPEAWLVSAHEQVCFFYAKLAVEVVARVVTDPTMIRR